MSERVYCYLCGEDGKSKIIADLHWNGFGVHLDCLAAVRARAMDAESKLDRARYEADDVATQLAKLQAAQDALAAERDAALGMLRKYANIVGRSEGVDFLYPSDWTESEWAVWRSVVLPGDRTEPLPEWAGETP